MTQSQIDVNLSLTLERLRAINKGTAEQFSTAIPSLQAKCTSAELAELSSLCFSIADAGWRSFECVELLLDIARATDDVERLIEIARLGEAFSGHSFEPSKRYFQLVRDSSVDTATIRAIEQAGLALQGKYAHAAGLLANYFETAQIVSQSYSTADVAVWVALLKALIPSNRDLLVGFLKLSGSAPAVNWHSASKMQAISSESCLIYIDWFPRVGDSRDDDERRSLDRIAIVHADDALDQLLPLLAGLTLRTPIERSTLLELSELIDATPVLLALLDPSLDLPLDKPRVVREWLETGIETMGSNPTGLLAWVSLESLGSASLMASLRGQVAFADHERTFALLSEAVCQRHVEVISEDIRPVNNRSGAVEASPVSRAVMPENDGRTVTLPAVVNVFETVEDNFGFYKSSLFHQLGYVEFGLFADIVRVNQTLNAFKDQTLAETLFMIVEDARIDWLLIQTYPGLRQQLLVQKARAAEQRAIPITHRGRWLEALVLISLDVTSSDLRFQALNADVAALEHCLQQIRAVDASIDDSLNLTSALYAMFDALFTRSDDRLSVQDAMLTLQELPEPIAYRGEIDVEQVESTLKIEALVNEWEDQIEAASDESAGMTTTGADDDQIDLGDLKKGDVGTGVSMIIDELEHELGLESGTLDPDYPGIPVNMPGGISSTRKEASRHFYDEWDYQINDYRGRWCTLFEHRVMDMDGAYVQRTLRDHSDIARQIRQQLNRVRPEMLRKVKGVTEGEELDLERSIAYLVDRKAGLLPEDKIYVQRQRKDRDVSTLFLLDMSASTDDIVPDPDVPPLAYPNVDDDEYLVEFFREQSVRDDAARKIIDLEKESVLLMADALERLGDAYSVCGFSGYGRDQVDYYLCKDFDDRFDERAKARIGGIKPCRSTRMGPPIRHGTRRLIETGSRIKAMIIISDGYPQDHDYGTDRNSRDYGLIDTMKALSEAKQQGVLTYCLTVDPSGHDYLRSMCPDSQYMVIQDIAQLPHELSRVYRSLTG
ncbi:MAG: nitric oxide reductase NorD protein [Candidatus Azotimanducaceae bacterium]|jgi:nitric oxide reductase NorD protein